MKHKMASGICGTSCILLYLISQELYHGTEKCLCQVQFFGLPLTTTVTYLWSLRLLHLCPQSDMFALFHSFFLSIYVFVCVCVCVCVHMLVDRWLGVHVRSGLMIGNRIVDVFLPSVRQMAGYRCCGLCHH